MEPGKGALQFASSSAGWRPLLETLKGDVGRSVVGGKLVATQLEVQVQACNLDRACAISVRRRQWPYGRLDRAGTLRFRLAIGHQLWQSSGRSKERPMSSSTVNFIAIVVRHSGAMSGKPC